MSSIILAGDTSGSVEIKSPAVAGNTILNLPATNGNLVTTGDNGTVTPSMLSQKLVQETAKNATGTAVDFTGIPSWVKKITVSLNGVSVTGTSVIIVQLGAVGGMQTSSYTSVVGVVQGSTSSVGCTAFTTGFGTSNDNTATYSYYGSVLFTNISGNIWTQSGVLINPTNNRTSNCGGAVTLTSTLTQLRITTVNGTDTFDAGSINIIYEG